MLDSGAVVVTYFPNLEAIENLEIVCSLCDKVIVADNTPGDMPINFPELQNLTVLRFGDNIGLAAALNIGIELTGEQGFENIFLFDQDSCPPDHFVRDMLIFKSTIDRQVGNFALYVPNFFDRNSKTFAKFPVITPFTVRHETCADSESLLSNHARLAITSGSLITYSRYRRIGPLREDYFIDFIDNEYCLRIDKLGLRIAVNCDVVLDHAIGRRSTHRFLGITIKPNHHSAVRRYYIARNGIRTAADYLFDYPSYAVLILARMSHELLSILLYENSKCRKIKGIFYGIYHGLLGRMGKSQIASLIS